MEVFLAKLEEMGHAVKIGQNVIGIGFNRDPNAPLLNHLQPHTPIPAISDSFASANDGGSFACIWHEGVCLDETVFGK